MADYRQIHTKIWKDGWFIELSDQEKLLFIYLFSNERASIAGLYELALRVICFETGLDKRTVEAALAKFSKAGKAHYENGIVWVVNLRKYNENSSPKVTARLSKDLAAVADCPIKRRYLAYYNPIESDGYGIDTVSIPVLKSTSEQEQEQEHEQEQEQERGADAPPPPADPKPKAAKAPNPAAVEAFRAAANTYPNKALWQSMAEAVGDQPDDVAFWQQVVGAWIAKGYNPQNVAGMFDFFKRRELPAAGSATKTPAPVRKYDPTLSPEELALKARIKAHKEQQAQHANR